MSEIKSRAFEQKTIMIDDIEFLLQQPAASWYLDHCDHCRDDGGRLKTSQYIQGLLENVVISPKNLKIDDFSGDIRKIRRISEGIEKFILGDEKNAEVPPSEKSGKGSKAQKNG